MSVVPLAEVKAHLNITVAKDDGEIQSLIDAAQAAIGERVGPLEPTPVSARVAGSRATLSLPVGPVVSLTSVTPVDGAALTLGDLHLDEESALVTFASGAGFGDLRYDVAYVAGRTVCPDDLKLAVKELVRHLWMTQRGPTARPGSAQSESAANTIPGAAYLFPFRIEQLVAPHDQPGFA